MTTYVLRPISDRTWLGSMGREPTRFKAKWSATEDLLMTEIGYLRGRDVVIEMDITEGDLKLNGELRANARPTSSAAVVAFESKHGPLLYRCDRFYTPYYGQGPEWQHNVRAIALTLQALRAVDRYGATETGQQYTGFKALGAGRAMPASHMTSDQARSALVTAAYGPSSDPAVVLEITRNRDALASTYRRARAMSHPDRHASDRTAWDKVEQAAAVLGLLS